MNKITFDIKPPPLEFAPYIVKKGFGKKFKLALESGDIKRVLRFLNSGTVRVVNLKENDNVQL